MTLHIASDSAASGLVEPHPELPRRNPHKLHTVEDSCCAGLRTEYAGHERFDSAGRGPPVNNQGSVALFLYRGYFDRFVAKLISVYRQRCAVMFSTLEHHFPGSAVEPAYGGGGIWLRLPQGADAGVLRDLVRPESVFFETGGFTFSDEGNNRNHIRLGYSVIGESLIPAGIDKIARALPKAAPEPSA